MKLSEMRELLDARGIRLTKSLGQNFLHDQNQLRKIAGLAELTPSDRVLEIGPGLGPLTEALLESGAHVLAIEKDKRLSTILAERFSGWKNFELLHADALEYLKTTPRDWSGWKLVSNLPYSVGSPILVELALADSPPERLVATLQLEVIERILAGTGSENYGQLSLFLQVRYQPAAHFKIPSSCFFPPPDVDSATILLRRRPTDLLPAQLIPLFLRIVKRAFSERRKVMAKLLKQDWSASEIGRALAAARIDPMTRAETVSVEQFVQLTLALASPAE